MKKGANAVHLLLVFSLLFTILPLPFVRARNIRTGQNFLRAAVSVSDDDKLARDQSSPEEMMSSDSLTQTTGHGEREELRKKRPKPCKTCSGAGGAGAGDDDDDGDGSLSECFPASARVYLSNARFSSMADLRVGDVVQLADTSEATIYAFSHRDENALATFLRILTPAGNLSVTTGHYVYNTENRKQQVRLSAAKDLREGDRLVHLSGKFVPITGIERYQDKGLYNPHATQDELVVDGFRVSTFTVAVAPTTATSLLAPLRAAFKAFCVDGLSAPMLWYLRSLQ